MEERLSQSNKGFTLAEICVVFVLISVLASITTFSLIAWQHESQFNKAELNAELIYMAARNKLAIYSANNVVYDNKELYCDVDDYGEYKTINGNQNLKANRQDTWQLFNMVSEYVYDKTILDAYIMIEFDENHNIKGVYYSYRTKFFNDSSVKGLKSEYNDASKRYDDLVGAYIP